MRFLVVDDSRAMQSIVKRTLRKAGYPGLEIKTASNGVEALDIIRVWKPDLVLSDWHMPEMDGIELMARITREMIDINIGFVTTENSPHRIAEVKAAGAMFVVTKPFQTEELLAAVKPVMDHVVAQQNAEKMSVQETVVAESDTFMLPDAVSFAEVVNDFCRQEVLVEDVPPISVGDKKLPCLVGLLDDGKSEVVRAVCVLELPAACILGGAMKGLGAEEVRSAIQSKTINATILEGCDSLFQALSITIRDAETGRELQLRSLNQVPKIFPKLEEIYADCRGGRSDFEVAIIGYGQGLMTIITAWGG